MTLHRGTFADYFTWLQQQPEELQHLAAEFGIGTTHRIDAAVLHVIGHREDDVLIMSPQDPSEDAERAASTKVYVIAELLRAGRR